ncbi:WD40-like Beta Propeller Repeat [Spirosomataceae bacterium TFI 002]|nr:WD40-like Beta Propeller Repeat [Spirosomataceae bacterium TFI 002]
MKQSLILIVFLLFLPLLGSSQSKKSKSYYDKGITAFKERDFSKAKIFFDKTLEVSPEWADAYFGMGQVYSAEMNKDLAAKYFYKTISLDSTNKTFMPAYSFLGAYELKANNYEKAKQHYTKALDWTQKGSRVALQFEKQIAACDFSILSIKNAYHLKPSRLSKVVNFKEKQYFPVLTADEKQLFFTARSGDGDEDIYFSESENGNWTVPKSISDSINTSFNEGTCTISADGKMLVFTSCEGRENFGSCDLYFSEKVKGAWSQPKNLGEKINSKYWDSQPSLSSDGHMLFFSSERPLGQGRKDLYVSYWSETEGWQEAQNLGKTINTFGDEVSPFIHANSKTLFFASNLHQGMGGYDLFLAEKDGINYSQPENLGYPINTEEDQLAMFITSNGKSAYYSVDRKDSVHLYQFEIPSALIDKISPTIYIKGKIVDAKTQAGIKSTIELIDINSNEKLSSFESDKEDGTFMAVVPSAGDYALYISNPAYFFKRLEFNVDDPKNLEEISVSMRLIEKDVPEVLKHIYFETASFALKDESRAELDKLTQLAKENPQLNIQIAGHTDDVGADQDNLLLSEKRAQSVIAYLKEKGIALNRLAAKGFGEAVPLVPNTNEENRQMNRRIELRFF